LDDEVARHRTFDARHSTTDSEGYNTECRGQAALACIITHAALMRRAAGREPSSYLACLLQMAEITTLREAVAGLVRDGDQVALEGFTHLIPFAAGHEVIRQGRKNLTLVRMTPDVIYDQLIGAGCAKKLIFSWGGNPGVGSLHRLRDAVEHDWPLPLEIQEHGHGDLSNAYVAGASKLPFAVLRAYAGSDLPKHNNKIKFIECPFTGEKLAAVPAIQPDVSIVHAQKADRKGNVLLWGILGVQKEAVLAAKRAIVTVEEIVDDLKAWPNACILPGWTISAVCCVPGGAFPSYAHGYYERDNRFYQAWDGIARNRETFQSWIKTHVLETSDFAEFRKALGESVERAKQ
jgi:glutaconate CoA-transferase, subunit A